MTTSTGGIMLGQGGYFAVPMPTIGMGGYAYAFADMVTPGGSTSCVNMSALCGKGTIGVANPPTYSVYGGGIGVNLNQLQNATTKMTTAATGSGIAYALSSLPALPTRMIVDNAGVDYCATLTAASGTVPWSSFFTQCYNLPGGEAGAGLGGPPSAISHVQFQVNSGATAGSFDFCITSLKFM